MDHKQLFRAFRRKLLWEAIFRGFLWALMLSAAGVFGLSLYYRIQILPTPVNPAVVIGASVFVPVFSLVFALRYPTRKKTAARIDGLGLQERAGTMLAYAKQDTVMAQLQREDAKTHIRQTGAKALRLQVKRSVSILCAVAVALAVTITALPYDVFAFGPEPDPEELRQQQVVKNMIGQLRESNRESQLDSSAQSKVDQILEELEEALKNAESEVERAALIEEARKKIEDLLTERQTHDKIGEALQKFEVTAPLGVGISEKSEEKISAALDGLETLVVVDDPTQRTPLCETIVDALSASMVDPDNVLYCAVAAISVDLTLANPDSPDYATKVAEAMDRALQDIMAALQSQKVAEEELGELEQILEDAKKELLGKEEEEAEETKGEQGGKEEQGKPSLDLMETVPEDDGELPEELPENFGGGGMMESTMTEGFYDPIYGYVTYGEVYATYYAEYLEALKNGEVSEELQEKLDRYFSGLE